MSDTSNRQAQHRHIVLSTAMMIGIFAITKAISLVQTFIIARFFGVGQDYDAYVTANRIPELIVVLIAGGALNYAFIPVFSEYLAKDNKARAWQLASRVLNSVFLVALIASLITFIFTPFLVTTVIAPGFDSNTTEQTIGLMRLLLVGTVVFSMSGLVSGILQSHQHFFLPALAPIMYDLGILFGVVVLLRPLGLYGVALGAVLGAFLHLFIQVPGLVRYGARWHAQLGWNDPDLWRVLRLMLPRIVGLGVFQFNFLVMTNIASRLGVGAVSAFDWGWRLMQIPQTLIGTAMGIVIFPTLASLSALGDENGKRTAMSSALRFILIASIPSAIGLMVVGRPLISLLEGGAFDASASLLVYSTLRAFMLGLIVHSILEIVARSFYADKDTFTPLVASLLGAVVNLVLSYWLSNVSIADQNAVFSRAILPLRGLMGNSPIFGDVSGLALANSLGTLFEVALLMWVLRGRWHGVQESTLAVTTLKVTFASLVMAVAIIGVEMAWQAFGFSDRGTLFTVGMVGVQVIAGGVVFLGVTMLLRLEELKQLWQLLRQRQMRQEVTA